MKAIFKIEATPAKAEKKHSRRYFCTDENFPIRTLYVMRPFSNKKDELEIEIKE